MGRVYYNGLHWNSPVNSTPQPQYNAGQKFQSAFVLAQGEISFNTCVTHYNGWKEQCAWIRNNGRPTQEIVLRLYWPFPTCPNGGCAMGGDPGPTLGQQFYSEIIQYAIDNFNIRNFQVLNELNVEYELDPVYGGCKPRQQLGGDMFNIAWWIKHLANVNNRGFVYLGFPGPGGNAVDPADPSGRWDAYWDFYKTYITMGTDQGPAYNWLAVHAYEFSVAGLSNLMIRQYNSLVSKLPQYPHRWTECGISLDGGGYCSPLPCGNPNAFQARANDYSSAIQGFKNYVDTRNPPGPDVWSVFYYIAYDSDAGAQGGQDTRYELVLNNGNLGPAQTVANAF